MESKVFVGTRPAGVHRVARTVRLSAEHVNLTIQNYEGERASLQKALVKAWIKAWVTAWA